MSWGAKAKNRKCKKNSNVDFKNKEDVGDETAEALQVGLKRIDNTPRLEDSWSGSVSRLQNLPLKLNN